MRYKPGFVAQVLEELRKTPNIRHVCSKLGIHRSTLYRWRYHHHTFNKALTSALDFGRDNINDAAEAVMISGIQNGDQSAARYWLAHNSPRYSTKQQHDYLRDVNENIDAMLREPTPINLEDGAFDNLFDIYFSMEKSRGEKMAQDHMAPIISFFFQGEADLEGIFYVAYAEWKAEKISLKKRAEAADKKKKENYEREKKEQAENPEHPGFRQPD